MLKSIFASIMALGILCYQAPALADVYATTPQSNFAPQIFSPGYGPCPYPTPGFPYPVPAPYIACFAQGLANGAYFYGISNNVYIASQWAMYACQMTGQYCQIIGCR